MRKLLSVIVVATTFSFSAMASDFAVAIGARTNSWDVSPPAAGTSGGGKTGFQGGVMGYIDVSPALLFRTGFMYTQRNYVITSGGTDVTFSHSYFDVPATLMYKFNDYGGIFGGAVLALNTGKSCSGSATCSTDGVKSAPVGFEFGASFKFAPQMGAEFYYEMIPGDIQTVNGSGGKDSKSVVANLLITFE